jgi:hypothetical protein
MMRLRRLPFWSIAKTPLPCELSEACAWSAVFAITYVEDLRYLRCETAVLSPPYEIGHLDPVMSSLATPMLLDVLNSGMVAA